MCKKIRRGVIFLLLFFCAAAYAYADSSDTLTITTYYPSPYGVYKQMNAYQVAIGSSYYNPTYADGTLYVQSKVGIGTSNPGTASLAVIGGNVGIGSTNPRSALDINGAVKFSSICDANTVNALRFDSANKVMQYCDGTSWKSVAGNGLIYHACDSDSDCSQYYNNSCKLCGSDPSSVLPPREEMGNTYFPPHLTVPVIGYIGGRWLSEAYSGSSGICQHFILCEE